MFEPLNPHFKGLYTYKNGNLNENCKTSFCISFEDIAGQPLIIPCPSVDPSDIEETGVVIHLQIYLKHTGNYYYATKTGQEVIESECIKGLASFDLKVKINGIDGHPWTNVERRQYADIVVNKICDRIPSMRSKRVLSIGANQKTEWKASLQPNSKTEAQNEVTNFNPPSKPQHKSPQSITSIPFFDIDFGNVLRTSLTLGFIEDSNISSNKKLTLQDVDNHLSLFKDIFGINCISDSISELKNQSFVPLDCLFDEIKHHKQEVRNRSDSTHVHEETTDLLLMSEKFDEVEKRSTSHQYQIDISLNNNS